MSTELKEKGKSIYEVTTGLKGEEWKKAQEKALNELAKQVTVNGFRKGEAPIQLAKKRISNAELFNKAIDIVIPDMFNEVCKEHKLNPLYRPDVIPTKVSDTEVEVTFRIICVPEVKLGKYKGIKVALDKVAVKAEEVEDSIKHLLEDSAEWVLKENGEAKKGDTVVIDFKGYVDGKEFEGGSSENYSLVLGSNSFVPGFEDQLIGAKPESSVTVKVTFPKQYVKDLAGKDATFACKVHEIKEKKIPTLDDEFVKGLKIEGVDTVAKLKDHQKKALTEQKEYQAKSKQFNDVLKQIIDGAKIEMADEIIANEAESIKQENINQMSQNGLTYDQFKEITGQSDESLLEQYKAQAVERLSNVLVLNKIAETEKLLVSEQEIKDYYKRLADQYHMEIEKVEEALKGQVNRVAQQILNQKIEKFIIENNIENKKSEEKKTTAKKEK